MSRKNASRKRRVILFIQIAGSMAGILLEILAFVRIVDGIRPKEPVRNVFDEMMADDARALRNSSNICNYKNYRPHEDYMRMEYSDIGENMSSLVWIYYDDSSGLTKPAPLYLSFSVYDEEENKSERIEFVYYKKVKKLYIYGSHNIREKETMSWEKLEYYKNYLLYDVIIGGHIDNGFSRFTADNPGEFEIIDYLIPYEYCGMSGSEVISTEEYGRGVSYTTWLDNGSLLCMQQTILHETLDEIMYDEERLLHVVFMNIPFMLTDEVFGRYTGASRFTVQKDGEECRLSDLIEIDDDLIGWIKNSGLAEGNLCRISPDRETGCMKTKQMLLNFPEEQMRTVLENCEFYIEPEYLHVRFPYWDYEAEEPGFVKNGNDLWRGWLTVKTDDIERFLKVEKW